MLNNKHRRTYSSNGTIVASYVALSCDPHRSNSQAPVLLSGLSSGGTAVTDKAGQGPCRGETIGGSISSLGLQKRHSRWQIDGGGHGSRWEHNTCFEQRGNGSRNRCRKGQLREARAICRDGGLCSGQEDDSKERQKKEHSECRGDSDGGEREALLAMQASECVPVWGQVSVHATGRNWDSLAELLNYIEAIEPYYYYRKIWRVNMFLTKMIFYKLLLLIHV